MLSTKIWIANPASIGGGKYTAKLYFSDPSRPQYVNLGDVAKDTAGNVYELVPPTLIPFADGATATLQYRVLDVIPVEDSDYNSDFYTPGQEDVRPQVRTAGTIFNASVYYGPGYEYELETAWEDPAEEAVAEVGDRLVDSAGKEYILTYIDSTVRFSVACRATEVEKEGISPLVGIATMYRPTSNLYFFQGTELTDYARTIADNRDKLLLDKYLITARYYYNNEIFTLDSGRVVIKSGTHPRGIKYGNRTSSSLASVIGILGNSIKPGDWGLVYFGGYVPASVFDQNDFTEGSLPSDGERVWLADADGKLTLTPPETASGNWLVIMGLWDDGGLTQQIQVLGVA